MVVKGFEGFCLESLAEVGRLVIGDGTLNSECNGAMAIEGSGHRLVAEGEEGSAMAEADGIDVGFTHLHVGNGVAFFY